MQADAAAAHPPALQSLNLASYIASLAPEARSQLYSSPWTCQAVFRALEPLGQQYVLRLLYAPEPLPDGARDGTARQGHPGWWGWCPGPSRRCTAAEGGHRQR
jgi:hypothetical protein